MGGVLRALASAFVSASRVRAARPLCERCIGLAGQRTCWSGRAGKERESVDGSRAAWTAGARGLARWGAVGKRVRANEARTEDGGASPTSRGGYLVDPARGSDMLVSKIKPCRCKYELSGRNSRNGLNQSWFIWSRCEVDNCGNSRANTCVKRRLREACFIRSNRPGSPVSFDDSG